MLPSLAAWVGLCWPILRPMLAHVDPSSATNSEKCEKMGTLNRSGFSMVRGGGACSAAGAAAPLSFGEERCRTAMPRPAPGPMGPWPDLRAR